ncbi:Glycosyl phosphatidyl inositol protein transamidase complex subunit [Madurella fahalii]|uniref:Glycosyl phosphatidyl inositol protein transamidase complex subunit n=1 Tax=Madurella fahalii TaxID=1157608 RepID=A0ABQ0GHL7_9PEZI
MPRLLPRNVTGFSTLRARAYVFRLPLFTRLVLAAIVLFWAVGVQVWWDVRAWGALVPGEMGFATLYRLNTFPFIHLNVFHAAMNVLALTPLLERFESEYGTLTSLALFFGPLTTLPAFIYVGIEKWVVRGNTAVMGASMWVFLLLGMEAIRTYKVNPYLVIGTHNIPTWTTPIALLLCVAALVPSSSFLGHLAGLVVGYVCGLGYLKFLAPPEKVLRWVEGKLNLLGRLPHYQSQLSHESFGEGTFGIAVKMPRLLASALQLRRDPRILKLPPYLSLLFVLVGTVWLFMLPLNQYSRRTYISENALLPGQVHTYFGGSDQNVFRAYKHEMNALAGESNIEINNKLEAIAKGIGLKTARQNFTYHAAGRSYAGENLYAILQAPRGDATEAIVLVAAWENVKHELNRNGVPLALTLARYFKRWSLWSKDIILLLTPDSIAGPQAWVDAYHDAHDPSHVASLPLKSGALQGAIAIDYAQEGRFDSLHIVYDGINGQLPNLDLINSIVNIARGQMGIGVALQEMWRHNDGYPDRLRTMLRGMLKQGLGLASGPHSSFIPYHVDAVTLRPFGEGWQDEMAMGRVVEGSFRSLNNLLEHLHQSFFFYLLMQRERFVSIGTYLPSAMLVAANFTIMAIALWVKSGYPDGESQKTDDKNEPATPLPTQTVERDLFLPLGVVTLLQFLSVIPLYLFNHAPESTLRPLFYLFAAINTVLPALLSRLLTTLAPSAPTMQQYHLIKSFSLILLGMFLSSLATLNFSLALIVGLLSAPLSFVRPFADPSSSLSSSSPAIKRVVCAALLNAVSPTSVLLAGALYWGLDVQSVLREAAVAWHVCGTWSAVVVWCVWWPAWLAGGLIVWGRPTVKGKAKAE